MTHIAGKKQQTLKKMCIIYGKSWWHGDLKVGTLVLHPQGWGFNSLLCHVCVCGIHKGALGIFFRYSSFLPKSRDIYLRLVGISNLFVVCDWVCKCVCDCSELAFCPGCTLSPGIDFRFPKTKQDKQGTKWING